MIGQILSQIDAVISGFVASTYGSLASEIGALILIMGGIGFTLLILNMILQIMPMHAGAIFGWSVKFLLVSAAASSWAFFEVIYDAVNGLADGLAGLLLGGVDISSGLDDLVSRLWGNYNTLMGKAGLASIGLGIVGALIGVLTLVLTTVSIAVISISKFGLGVALGLAPIFIASLMFKATSDLFSSWTKWTLTFVMNLVMVAAVLGITAGLIDAATVGSENAQDLEAMLPTLIIASCLVFFISQVPSYASALAGSMAVGGMSLTSAGGAAARGITGAAKGAAGSATSTYTGAKVAGSVIDAGRESKAQGGSLRDRGAAMLGEYTDIHNKARATTNSRLRGAAAENSQARKDKGQREVPSEFLSGRD